MTYDVCIIGGGAAGLSAALSASHAGARVLILEAASRVGRKILASGNGRCNLANTRTAPYPGGGELARRVLAACPPERVLDFFHGLGLATAEEDGGRVYPACGHAAAVLDTLRAGLERQGVEVRCDCPVKGIAPAPGGFRLTVPAGMATAECRAAVAAFGGMAGGRLGHDGGPYRLLTALGHTLVPPRPALCPLETEKAAVKGLSGLRLPAILTLCRGGEPVEAAQGEMLFTDYGVSGVCVMELSRRAGEILAGGDTPELYLDFSPMLGLEDRRYARLAPQDPFRNVPRVRVLLEERRHRLPQEDVLLGLAPRLLREKLRGQTDAQLARSLSAMRLPVTGLRGMDQAQVTSGGISAGEFDPDTLASRRTPGLFAAGEALDVDGVCGGYNLQFAFASGLIAGRHAALSARSRCAGRTQNG